MTNIIMRKKSYSYIREDDLWYFGSSLKCKEIFIGDLKLEFEYTYIIYLPTSIILYK